MIPDNPRSSGVPPLRLLIQSGFSLTELLVVLGIMLVVMAISTPFLGRMRSSTMQIQTRAEVLAAMQANMVMLNTYRKPDADSGEPRLSGVTYSGTSVFFDSASERIYFSNNNQFAQDISKAQTDPLRFLERQTFTDSNGTVWGKVTYDLLKQVEPVRIPSNIGIAGIVRDDNNTPADPSDDKIKLIPMPFAVCCGSDTYGLPVAPSVYADLNADGLYEQIAAANPAVIVYLREDVIRAGANPDDLSTLPGATSQDKVQSLLFKCKGMLIELSVQNGAELDTQ